MTSEAQALFRRAERATLVVAILALIVAVILGVRSPDHVLVAWRLAVFACLQPALGSLIFILVHRMTGGAWLEGLEPFLLAGTRLLPWVWVLIIPLLWFPIAAQPYDTGVPHEHVHALQTVHASDTVGAVTALETAMAGDPERYFGHTVEVYFSHWFIVTRAVIFGVAFFLLAAGARRIVRFHPAGRMRWFGPAGLIGLVLLLHLLVIDWIMLLEPGWISTGFPLVWMAAQGLAGLAAAICAAILFGADPNRGSRLRPKRAKGIDWGNLLLASVMSWMYVAFVQWLIIYSGNLPSESSWYEHRSQGGWAWYLPALAIIEFGAPFLLLLSRALKRSRGALAVIAALLLLGQLGYTIWIIVPAFPRAASAAPWLEAAAFVFGLALFFNRYVAVARAAAPHATPPPA